MHTIMLKAGRSTPFTNRHPWLFSGAIVSETASPQAGEWVRVVDSKGIFIANGLYNPYSQIRIRLYSFDESELLSEEFWYYKIKNAISYRYDILGFSPKPDTACRLINSEGDGLSGLTVDRYGNYLALQFTSLALYQHRDIIIRTLAELTACKGIVIRTEADMLTEENLELKDGLVYGNLPETPVIIKEDDVLFEVNLHTGQKSGFYLDQRANRSFIERFVSHKSILDLCTYSGGFALHSAKAGAKKVTAVDISASALQLAQRNTELNNIDNIEFIKSDMFKYLEKCLSEEKKYDVIVLDPPKMTHSKGAVRNALSGYLRLNTSALQCLNQCGILVTCSCSGRISRDAFLEVLHRASVGTGRYLSIMDIRGADIDHPVSTACPESEYLKCVVCYVK